MRITPNVPTGAFTLNAWATWDVLFDDNGKAVALFSSKSKLSQLTMAAPEMFELLGDVRRYVAAANLRGDGYAEIDLKTIDALLAKIEGGEA